MEIFISRSNCLDTVITWIMLDEIIEVEGRWGEEEEGGDRIMEITS